MSADMNNKTTLDKATIMLGTVMMIAWTLMIGVFGFVLLAAGAYGITSHRYTLVTVCAILLFSPLLMTIVWGLFSAIGIVSKQFATDYAMAGPTWWEQRQDHRILYQAYYL